MTDASLRVFRCGHTVHDLGMLVRGRAREVRTFPSQAFLYDAGDGRRVLFDTGYPSGGWPTGVASTVYRRLLPPSIDRGEGIADQLRAVGLGPETVTHIVLSHLHPDHIGGLVDFPDAEVIITRGHARTLGSPRVRDALLADLLPSSFPDARTRVLEDSDFVATVVVEGAPLARAHDLFGDGAYLLVSLPGHADGHIGALVEGRVLLAADAAWNADLLRRVDDMRPLPRWIQHDAGEYARTARTVTAWADRGLQIVLSHDPCEETELL